jgi:hypothetical protein
MNKEDYLIAASTDKSFMYTIAESPKHAGGYRMGGNTYNTKFMLLEKPCWLHRKMAKLLLGWEWVDNT